MPIGQDTSAWAIVERQLKLSARSDVMSQWNILEAVLFSFFLWNKVERNRFHSATVSPSFKLKNFANYWMYFNCCSRLMSWHEVGSKDYGCDTDIPSGISKSIANITAYFGDTRLNNFSVSSIKISRLSNKSNFLSVNKVLVRRRVYAFISFYLLQSNNSGFNL